MEPAMTMSLFQVQEIVPLLDVRDMASSMAFYIDGLGFEVTLSWTPEGEIRWLRLQQGGAGAGASAVGAGRGWQGRHWRDQI
jgi:hypothetical protein